MDLDWGDLGLHHIHDCSDVLIFGECDLDGCVFCIIMRVKFFSAIACFSCFVRLAVGGSTRRIFVFRLC